MPIFKKCKQCNNDFKASSYSIKNGIGNFCSSRCYGDSMKNIKRKPLTMETKEKIYAI